MGIKNSKAMEVVKKNLLSIICGVVAILAVAATFWPVGKMFETLQSATDQRGSVYSELQGLLTKPRQKPLTDPSQTQQEDLKIFPNQNAITAGDGVVKQVNAQSTDMVALIVKLNQTSHTPLVPYVLPDTTLDNLKFRFGDLYKAVLSVDPAKSIQTDPQLKDVKLQNLRNDVLQGGIPPTEAEITQAKADLKTNVFDPRVILVAGAPSNQADVDRDYAKAAALLPDQLRYKVANEHKIYVANDIFPENPAVVGQTLPNTTDIWYSQMTLWVQQDVANALAKANGKSQSILDAPVKHLVKLTIPASSNGSAAGGAGFYTDAPQAGGGAAAPPPPAPVEGSDTLQLTPNFAVSPTGRYSNPLYDVVQFTLVINVDASQLPAVLASLSDNQLMDVMYLTETSVDSEEQQRAGFFYGPAPVVQLTLSCEALFMRQWTAPLMPDAVKRQRGIAPATPPAQ